MGEVSVLVGESGGALLVVEGLEQRGRHEHAAPAGRGGGHRDGGGHRVVDHDHGAAARGCERRMHPGDRRELGVEPPHPDEHERADHDQPQRGGHRNDDRHGDAMVHRSRPPAAEVGDDRVARHQRPRQQPQRSERRAGQHDHGGGHRPSGPTG